MIVNGVGTNAPLALPWTDPSMFGPSDKLPVAHSPYTLI